jgi:hypothetical protein
MAGPKTVFGSLARFEKGRVEAIKDDPKHYALSNVYEVASKSKAWERVVVGKNQQYVIEAVRAEGTSPWYTAAHDEFVLVMDGEVEISFLDLANPQIVPANKAGSVELKGQPEGKKMGSVKARRGHQTLLPPGAAYRIQAATPAALLFQTILGDLSVERWAEICQTR